MIAKVQALQIAREVIKNNFPELKSVWITYTFVSGKDYDYYISVNCLILFYRIFIETEILNFSPEAFRGCLAHEFAHIVLDKRKSLFNRILGPFGNNVNEPTEEREADLLVIEKGLGIALLKFHKEHNKEYKSYNSNEGLTTSEIKRLLKSKMS